MKVVGGSMARQLASIICRDLSVCSILERMRTLDKGLEAWGHFIASGQYAPTASTPSLSMSVDHRKHPLTSTSCHPGALAKGFTGYDFSSLATVVPRL
ncbi:hypothetical protein PoB_007200700 [Plakobranchus ocellatus]|uniref:Uncharacterized protein n=1 Tax=Plakobranchus ocellatus TaxID=259542 RepID=A0AAV4DN21_9GAST|nr:hypothetical protein PoB_007200700 [Plakobranchus ocellatus]